MSRTVIREANVVTAFLIIALWKPHPFPAIFEVSPAVRGNLGWMTAHSPENGPGMARWAVPGRAVRASRNRDSLYKDLHSKEISYRDLYAPGMGLVIGIADFLTRAPRDSCSSLRTAGDE